MSGAERPTPYLRVDTDRLRANVARAAEAAAAAGVVLRPHAKTHKSADIARLQLDAGAVGLTVATVGEAEAFAAAGVTDLFVAYPSADRAALHAVASNSLAAATTTVTIDSVEHVAFLAGVERRTRFGSPSTSTRPCGWDPSTSGSGAHRCGSRRRWRPWPARRSPRAWTWWG